ncbi:MAG: hypothetical protein ACFFAO_22080 [Candidatus Hermodarchaeota archaeon]
MELSTLDFLQGLFSLIFVIISLFIGLIILSKYFVYHHRLYILVGLSWIGISSPWFGDAVNYLLIITTGEQISPFLSFLISFSLLPVFVLCWLVAFNDLTTPNNKWLIIVPYLIIGIIFEVIFFYYLFTDVSLLGTYIGLFHLVFTPFMQLYLFVNTIVFLITGLIFSGKSMKSEDDKVRIKGRFLGLAFIVFIIGAVLESLIPLTATTVVIARIVMILSALLFYLGFILPEWVAKIFVK